MSSIPRPSRLLPGALRATDPRLPLCASSWISTSPASAWGALSAAGHDVRAADSESDIFDAMEDERLLEVAANEEHVLVSRNVRDFQRIAGEWARAGRSHARVILIPHSLYHAEFGAIMSGVEASLADTDQSDWQDRFEWTARASG